MFKTIRPASLVSLAEKIVILGLLGYGALTSVLLLKLKPQPILIGIDQYGTRVLKESDDRLIKMERHNFVKKFIASQYNFNSENYVTRISESGDLFSRELWEEKQEEFSKIAEGLKAERLTQVTEVEDLREVDANTYQADLLIRVKNKLKEASARLRVTLKIKYAARREANPYPYEVESYDEQVL